MDNKCRKANKLINGYIDNLLNENNKSFFEKHIKECPNCKKDYEELKELISNISETQYVEVPADFSAKLHLRLAQESQKADTKKFTLRPYVNIAVSAALICAVVFGANLYEQYSNQINEELVVKNDATISTNETVKSNVITDIETKDVQDTIVTDSKKNIITEKVKTESITEQVLTETVENNTIETTDTVTQDISNIQQISEENVAAIATASETTEDMPISSNDDSSTYSVMRKMVFYAEYSVDLTLKPEILETLKSEFKITDDNTLLCDDNEFSKLVEILNDNDLYLNFIQEREADNYITFK